MAITVQCECGKTLRVTDELAGKRIRCPTCRKPVAIPPKAEGAAAAPSAAADEPLCPNCGERMAAEAKICVHCGYNTLTGAVVEGAAAEGEAEAREGPAFVLPTGKIIVGAVIIGVLAVGWFFLIKPWISSLRVGYAVSHMSSGNLHKALDALRALRPRVGGASRRLVDLRIRQIDLELQKNAGPVLGEGHPVLSDRVELDVQRGEPTGGAQIFKVTIRNHGQEPLAVSRDYFYIRGVGDLSLVSSHSENLPNLVVPPGEAREGLLAFRAMPIQPVMVRTGLMSRPAFFLIFNDGQNYVKIMLVA